MPRGEFAGTATELSQVLESLTGETILPNVLMKRLIRHRNQVEDRVSFRRPVGQRGPPYPFVLCCDGSDGNDGKSSNRLCVRFLVTAVAAVTGEERKMRPQQKMPVRAWQVSPLWYGRGPAPPTLRQSGLGPRPYFQKRRETENMKDFSISQARQEALDYILTEMEKALGEIRCLAAEAVQSFLDGPVGEAQLTDLQRLILMDKLLEWNEINVRVTADLLRYKMMKQRGLSSLWRVLGAMLPHGRRSDRDPSLFVRARVADWEKHYIDSKAKEAGISESEFVRRAAMDKDVTVLPGVDELVRELRYQGNNLNQLTVMARQGRIRLVDLRPFLEVYQRTWQALNSLLSRVG